MFYFACIWVFVFLWQSIKKKCLFYWFVSRVVVVVAFIYFILFLMSKKTLSVESFIVENCFISFATVMIFHLFIHFLYALTVWNCVGGRLSTWFHSTKNHIQTNETNEKNKQLCAYLLHFNSKRFWGKIKETVFDNYR